MVTFATASNMTSFTTFLHYSNTVAGNTLGIGLLIVIFVISFLSMKSSTVSYGGVNAKIFSACSFITMVFAVMFFILGIITSVVMYATIIMTALGIFANMMGGE